VQRLIDGLAFLDLLNGECPELELSLAAADAPVRLCSIRGRKNFNDRIRQYGGQLGAIILRKVQEAIAMAARAPEPQRPRGPAWFDAKYD
jgi:hypothetical protein